MTWNKSEVLILPYSIYFFKYPFVFVFNYGIRRINTNPLLGRSRSCGRFLLGHCLLTSDLSAAILLWLEFFGFATDSKPIRSRCHGCCSTPSTSRKLCWGVAGHRKRELQWWYVMTNPFSDVASVTICFRSFQIGDDAKGWVYFENVTKGKGKSFETLQVLRAGIAGAGYSHGCISWSYWL